MEAIMSMKTILVPMEKHDGMQSVLETALLLARRYDSYIEGFPLRWATVDFALGDIAVAFPVEQYKREMAAEAQRARQTFETFMQIRGVPRSTERTTSLSFGWLNEPLEGETFVGNYGRAFDVIVMNRPDAMAIAESTTSAFAISSSISRCVGCARAAASAASTLASTASCAAAAA
jgi:hypothetical protein